VIAVTAATALVIVAAIALEDAIAAGIALVAATGEVIAPARAIVVAAIAPVHAIGPAAGRPRVTAAEGSAAVPNRRGQPIGLAPPAERGAVGARTRFGRNRAGQPTSSPRAAEPAWRAWEAVGEELFPRAVADSVVAEVAAVSAEVVAAEVAEVDVAPTLH